MVIKQAELEAVCGITSKLPENAYPEVAFAGKSNVGKSSLINSLVNRKALARTSSQPGKTQTINFYRINQAEYLVDLPGYGYAKVPQSEKEKWGMLIDIRHEPGKNDAIMYDWICQNGFAPIIIATKLDKIKRSQVQKQIKLIREGLAVKPGTTIIPFSAQTKQGVEEVWAAIEALWNGEL